MPLYPLENSRVPCPYCGLDNFIAVHKYISWFNDKINLPRLLAGNLNTFECVHCHKLGFSKQTIKIGLEGRAYVYFKPIFPEESPSDQDETGASCFCEPLGQPLVLLKKFIDDYEQRWQEKNRGNFRAHLFRDLD